MPPCEQQTCDAQCQDIGGGMYEWVVTVPCASESCNCYTGGLGVCNAGNVGTTAADLACEVPI